MNDSPWLPFAAGSIISLGATLFFLYALHLGLTRRRWWPLAAIVCGWIILMAAYSLWDSGSDAHGSRKRIQSERVPDSPGGMVLRRAATVFQVHRPVR